MKNETDFTILLLIVGVLFVIDAISTLYDILKNGIMIDKKQVLMKLKCNQLREMLISLKVKPKRMNKTQMVDAIILFAQ